MNTNEKNMFRQNKKEQKIKMNRAKISKQKQFDHEDITNQLPSGAFDLDSSVNSIPIKNELLFIEKKECTTTNITKKIEEEFTDDYFEPIVYRK